MELRRLSICFAFFVLAVVSQCSEARHAVRRRSPDFSDEAINDEPDYAQDDRGNNDVDETEAEIHYTITTAPENFRMLVGRNVRLECKVTPADDFAVVSWIKGESSKLFLSTMKLTKDPRYSVPNGTHDLLIKDLNAADSDNYTCKVEQSNPVSITHTIVAEQPPMVTNPETTTMDNVDIVIDDSPRIDSFTTSLQKPKEGDNVSFSCVATGIPQPTILLSRRRHNSDLTERILDTLRNVKKTDSGVYYCYAINDKGNATSELTLFVHGKPRVHAHRQIINTDIGVEAVLKCSTHDEPNEIIWLKDNKNVSKNDNFVIDIEDAESTSTLTVLPSNDDDFGTFTCQSTNDYGTHNKSIKLVQQPVIENVAFEGLKLTWTVHSHQPLENIRVILHPLSDDTEERVVEVPLPSNQARSYDLIHVFNDHNLHGQDYDLSIKVKNSKEWSEPSDPIRVKIDIVAQPIQTASVFGMPDAASSIRASTFLVNAILMYLLVRML